MLSGGSEAANYKALLSGFPGGAISTYLSGLNLGDASVALPIATLPKPVSELPPGVLARFFRAI